VAKQGSCFGGKVNVNVNVNVNVKVRRVDNNIRDDINVVSGFACECLTVIKSPHTCTVDRVRPPSESNRSPLGASFHLRRRPSQATVDCVERRFEVINHREA
jgi:hypothetical protein